MSTLKCVKFRVGWRVQTEKQIYEEANEWMITHNVIPLNVQSIYSENLTFEGIDIFYLTKEKTL
jgi:hypothetical protein